MKFGLLVDCHVRKDQGQVLAFDEMFEQIDAAEAMGLDSIWIVEHHFRPQASVLSASMAVAGGIAARTKRIRIGTAVQVLPLGNPLRIAEEVASIDHMSHGRFDFGVGRSSIPKFYEGFNIPYSESTARFTESFEIVMRAFTQDTFSFEGDYYSYHDISISPRPLQKPHPPIYMAVRTPEGFAATARRGFHVVLWFMGDYYDDCLQIYREEWEAAGHPEPPEIHVRFPLFIGETEALGRETPRASVVHDLHRVIAEATAMNAPERVAKAKEYMENYDEFLRTRVAFGSPESVIDRLEEFRERMGLTGFILDMNHGGQIPHEQVLNSIRLLTEKVAPRFA
jgi:alkanesulfonate monooxygenase SsuD/methylene tetrahydromethanopterin reductase-like flavin-dependent oxidoreductase (luciferase family)